MLSLILLLAAAWIALDVLVVAAWVAAAHAVRRRGQPVPAMLDLRPLRRRDHHRASLRRSA